MSTTEEALGAEMSIIDHLVELRKRVIFTLIAVAVGTAVSWIWVDDIFRFIILPLEQAAPNAEMAKIHIRDLTETFFTLLKTAMVAGVFVSSPIMFYNLWAFIAPGLYSHEKRVALPFVFIATLFFLGGASFCYFLVMPLGFEFLFKFSTGLAQPTLMMSEHYALSIKLLLAFGTIFEMPVVAMFLSALGVITHHTLIRHWRVAIVGSFIFGALLTPPDVGTQLMMAVPLVALYAVSIGVAWFFTARRARAAAREAAQVEQSGGEW